MRKKKKHPWWTTGLSPFMAGFMAASGGWERSPPRFLPAHTERYAKQWINGFDSYAITEDRRKP